MSTQSRFVKRILVLAVLVAVGGGLVVVSRGWADGLAEDPLYYSGVLEEDGAPVEGTRNLEVDVWDDAVDDAESHLVCRTRRDDVPVTAGRFRVALDPGCVDQVHRHPDLWVELRVGDDSLGRSKIGAVPYAVESASATGASGALRQELDRLVPPGTVAAFAGSTAPQGWLLCDGVEVSRTDYAALFAGIGIAHGAGNGSTTFRLPDYRGRFLRGVDAGAGRDPDAAARLPATDGGSAGDAVGSIQGQGTAMPYTPFVAQTGGNHTHSTGIGADVYNVNEGGWNVTQTGGAPTGAAGDHTHTITGGDSETRPTNAGVNWIIKY